jgi:Protein of unknown function (DUF1571)
LVKGAFPYQKDLIAGVSDARPATLIPALKGCLQSSHGRFRTLIVRAPHHFSRQKSPVEGSRAGLSQELNRRPLKFRDSNNPRVNAGAPDFKDRRGMKRLKQLWQISGRPTFGFLWRQRKRLVVPPGTPRQNCLAGMIVAMSLGILFLTFRTRPAGAGLDTASKSAPQIQSSAPAATISEGSLGNISQADLNKQIQTAIRGSRLSLQLHVALLEVGKHRIEQCPDYTATFVKQEKLDGGDLQDVQSIEFKLRHKPFSLYMKWLEGGDVGRELLLVEGQYDEKMLVRLGGIKKKLPLMKLDPNSSLAMAESRHPVTDAGLLHLAEKILKYRKRDLTLKSGLRWEMHPDQKFMGRVCDCWIVEYDSPEVEKTYRKSVAYIDRELSLPICVRNYGWPEKGIDATDVAALDEATLIEYYGYTDIKLDERVPDIAFDKANSDYTFRR